MTQAKTTDGARKPTARRRRWLWTVAAILVAALVGGELFARFYLGLGNPPLVQLHPTIEYVLVPNQNVRRFGNRFETNSYSMRSREFAKRKDDPRELRILVLGDSIINGGSLTDQDDVSTELLRVDLEESLARPVAVGNISAGSWGPPNLLAYVKEFGTFDADIAVIVISSHDAADVPTFDPLDANIYPQTKPPSALWEAMTRYLPRYLPGGGTPSAGERPRTQSEPSDARALEALEELIKTFQRASAKVIVVQYETEQEVRFEPEPGKEILGVLCQRLEATVIQLRTRVQAAVEAGDQPYRDDGLHPNDVGQRLIFEAMREGVLEALDPIPGQS